MADVSVKMNVTGVAQFKSAMTQGKAAVKALDAELKLAQAQYKQTGDKEEYLRQRTEILKKQIAEQEKVVKSAQQALAQMQTNGTDPASAAYQNMAAQVANAQTSLVQMQTALAQGTDAFEEGTDAVDEYADRLERIDKNVSFQSTIQGLKAVKGAIQTAINVAKGINSIVVDAGKWADSETTTVAQYEDFLPDAETLQRHQHAADRMKVDFDDVLKAWDRINRLQREGGSILFGDYGIADLGSAEENFWGILDALTQIADENERNNLAQDIFGKSWRELNPLIGNRDQWNRYMEEARVTSNENVDILDAAKDLDDDLQDSAAHLKRSITVKINPLVTRVKDQLINEMDILADWVDGEYDVWEAIGKIQDKKRLGEDLFSLSNIQSVQSAGGNKQAYDLLRFQGYTDDEIYNTSAVQSVAGAGGARQSAMLLKMQGYSDEEIELMLPKIEEAATQYAQTVVEGIEAESTAAYSAGQTVADNFVRGAAAGGGGSPVYNTDNTYINGVNVYGATSPEEIAAAYTGEMNRNRAGTGG